MLHQRVLRWAGHVARMPNTRVPKQILFAWWPEGTRTSANSMSGYKFRLAEALRDRQIPELVWLQMAQNRNKWRQLVNGKNYNELQQPRPSGTSASATSSTVPNAKASAKPAPKPKAKAKAKPGYLFCPYPGCGQQCKGKLGLAMHTQMKHIDTH